MPPWRWCHRPRQCGATFATSALGLRWDIAVQSFYRDFKDSFSPLWHTGRIPAEESALQAAAVFLPRRSCLCVGCCSLSFRFS